MTRTEKTLQKLLRTATPNGCGLSQLAADIGLDKSQVSRFRADGPEHRGLHIEALEKIARHFGLKIALVPAQRRRKG